CCFLFKPHRARLALDSFPTRRASDLKISITTVMAAYRQLENSGLIEARPQSGYYVIARGPSVVAPRREPPSDPQPVTLNNVMRRSEEHTSELQSRENLVCRLLLEKKK